MSIKIGDNNKIKNSIISDRSQINQEKLNWAQRHPIITGVAISVISGVILLFAFWKDAVGYIESLWK